MEHLEAASLHEVHDKVRRPSHVPALEDLFALPGDELTLDVPKTNGELRVHIRHDDEGDHHGLFVHGFRSGSLAEGILAVGDELLVVNGVSVKSLYLEDVINAMRGHTADTITMVVRRHSASALPTARSSYAAVKSARSLFDEMEHLEAASLHEVHDKVRRPSHVPALEDLFALPGDELTLDVPKTNGELRVHIRHDDEGGVGAMDVDSLGIEPSTDLQRKLENLLFVLSNEENYLCIS